MMNMQGALHEAQRLRMRIQIDSRLRLEVLAALSRTFREHGERVSDELLRTLVFAVPQELPGEGAASKAAIMASRTKKYEMARIPPQPGALKRKPVSIPPQPGGVKRNPPPPIPPQPGGVKRPKKYGKPGKKSAKKSGKKR